MADSGANCRSRQPTGCLCTLLAAIYNRAKFFFVYVSAFYFRVPEPLKKNDADLPVPKNRRAYMEIRHRHHRPGTWLLFVGTNGFRGLGGRCSRTLGNYAILLNQRTPRKPCSDASVDGGHDSRCAAGFSSG